MECCFVHEYIKQKVKDPEYSEPKWFAVNDVQLIQEFPRAALIYVHQIVLPILDGGAAGLTFVFQVNGTTLVRLVTPIGLQSDVKVIPLNHFITTKTIRFNVNDVGLTFNVQL